MRTGEGSVRTRRTARRALRAAGALVALGALLVALAASPADAGDGVPSLEELRAFAQKLIESKEVEVFPFHVSVSEGVVTFDSGDVVACSQSAALCSEPLGVLVRAQCRIELLRNFVTKEEAAGRSQVRAFWTPTIDESEKVLRKTLAAMAGRKHTPGVLARRAYMALWRVEEVLLTKLWNWADETGAMLQTLAEQGGDVADPCAPPPAPFSTLSIKPGNGTIHYLPAIDWDIVTLAKHDPVEQMTSLEGPSVELPAGAYVVKAEWPDGAKIGPERIKLDGEHVIQHPK